MEKSSAGINGREWPLVSVIIPVYNVRPYLDECIRSILEQTYQNMEILVIDDGSADGCSERCDYWQQQDQRIRVIHQENRGLSGARNTGLEAARGEYISFVDSDDYLNLDMVRRMVETAEGAGIELVICGVHMVDVEGKELRVNGYPPGKYSKEEMLRMRYRNQVPATVWNKLYRRTMWRHLRFPEGRVYEDMAIINDVLWQSERTVIIGDALYYYRQRRPGSITYQCSWKNEQDYMWACLEGMDFVDSHMPELLPLARRSLEVSVIRSWNRMAQPESGCPAEELKKMKKYALEHCWDLSPANYRQWVLVILMRLCPGFSAWLYRMMRMR